MVFCPRGSGCEPGRSGGSWTKALDYRQILRVLFVTLAVSAGFGTGCAAVAQPVAARILVEKSTLESGFWGRDLTARLQLDRPVPFRVFLLDAPRRLVVDFEGLDPAGGDLAGLARPGSVVGARFGRMRPGWARLVVDLGKPMGLDTAEMVRNAAGAVLDLRLTRVSAEEFAARAGAPAGVWPSGALTEQAPGRGKHPGRLTVVLDPGHGGIDPGALRDGIVEKDVVLDFARDLRAALEKTGRFDVFLTRDADDFVSLTDRVVLAKQVGADAFLSLHTNAVEDPSIGGVIAFTLSSAGSSRSANDRAAVENRADRVAGVDPAATGDPVFGLLDQIARVEGAARSDQLARDLARALAPLSGGTTQDPLQSANFQVLRGASTPSVLLELGFLSNEADRANMLSPPWRARAGEAVARAFEAWAGMTRK